MATPMRRVDVERSGRHYQTPDGTMLPSVTTILQAIGKPALINWAAKVEREMVIEAAAQLWDDVPTTKKMSRVAYVATLTDRIGKTRAHQKLLTKAGEIGTEAHSLIEWNLRKEVGQKVGPQPQVSDKALWAFMAYEEWRKSVNLQPRAMEQTVWSTSCGYAGTMDLLGTVTLDGAPCLALLDWKTGKAIYAESLLQNSAYVHALLDMQQIPAPIHGLIVRLPKVETDPDFEVKVIQPSEQAALFDVFLAVKALWQWQQAEDAKRAADPRPNLVAEIEALRVRAKLEGDAWTALCKATTGFTRLGYAMPDKLETLRTKLQAELIAS